jgi:hypothetical protein
MNRFLSVKFLAVATLATLGIGAATVTEARPEVYLSIGLQGEPAWVEPARGYVEPRRGYHVQPRPVYVEPAPVYVRPPVFVAPREAFERRGRRGDDARLEWERERAWRHAEWRRQEWRDEFRRGDRDHHKHRKHHHDYRD